MKKHIASLLGAAALISLAGCGGGYVGASAGGPYYDGYYDGYYGPLYDGYWEGDHFWYSGGAGRPFVRDEGVHFRHSAANGFHHFSGHTMGAHPAPAAGGEHRP